MAKKAAKKRPPLKKVDTKITHGEVVENTDRRIGNQFWKMRSKHGRDKLFATPELLWEASCEYFEWCQENPLIAHEAKVINIGDFQSQVEIAKVPKLRAFNLYELCIYLGCNTKYFNDLEESLRGKNDSVSKDYSEVCTRIRETIFAQKFTGASAGLLNHNIIARDLGLVDKQENKIQVEQPLFGDAGSQGT